MNKLIPGSVKRINKKGSNFQLMENHAAFQKGMKKFGVPDDEIFQTVDLFEARNIKQVVKSLAALGRIVSIFINICVFLNSQLAHQDKTIVTPDVKTAVCFDE